VASIGLEPRSSATALNGKTKPRQFRGTFHENPPDDHRLYSEAFLDSNPPSGGLMSKIHAFSLFLVLFIFAGIAKADDDISLSAVPPVVVKTTPEAGTGGIDPATTEIQVAFSKDMADGSWSWSTASKDSFPEISAKPHYLKDKRTCVLPVKLKPGKVYAIWLNSQNFGNFKDTKGNSAVPYLLVFETKL
jgi:hypothetical protein